MKTVTLYLRYFLLRGFLLGLFLLFLGGFYFFKVSHVSFGTEKLFNPIFQITKDIPTWLYAVEYLIFVFIMAFVIISAYMSYYYISKNRREKIYNKYLNLFAENQFEFMFSETEYTREKRRNEIQKIKHLLNSDYKKRVFLNLLRKVNVQIIGDGRISNLQFLTSLKYDYLIFAYLHSPLLRHKLFALKIISDFQLEGYDNYILKLVNRKNNVLHTEALVSILKLGIYDSLHFLNEYKIKLTIWDINIMVKTILQMKTKNIDYLDLINSENTHISGLGIMLARINKRKELKSEIKMKISNTNEFVSEEAFLTFISFADEQSDYDFLMYTFEIATEKAQLLIVQQIVNYKNTVEKIKFLNWVVENKSLPIKVEAIRVLLDIDLTSVERFKHSNDLLIRHSCLQVLDFNLV